MIDEELTICLRDPKGQPLRVAGVKLDIHFYTGGRFRYSFCLGQTDADGVCRTTLDRLEEQLEANQRLFLMDYNTPLADCDTLVGIMAPTPRELAEREAARAKWWPDEPSIHANAANHRVHSREHKFELGRGRRNAFNLVCETEKPT